MTPSRSFGLKSRDDPEYEPFLVTKCHDPSIMPSFPIHWTPLSFPNSLPAHALTLLRILKERTTLSIWSATRVSKSMSFFIVELGRTSRSTSYCAFPDGPTPYKYFPVVLVEAIPTYPGT